MVERVLFDDQLISVIIRHNFGKPGVTFFTPNNLSQQLAFIKQKAGHKIDPHVHNTIHRVIINTEEVLFIKKGRLRVDFYSQNQEYIESRILETGDVILLISGGHGFQALEDIEMIEVKQGPYAGDKDKTRFLAIENSKILIEERES